LILVKFFGKRGKSIFSFVDDEMKLEKNAFHFLIVISDKEEYFSNTWLFSSWNPNFNQGFLTWTQENTRIHNLKGKINERKSKEFK